MKIVYVCVHFVMSARFYGFVFTDKAKAHCHYDTRWKIVSEQATER